MEKRKMIIFTSFLRQFPCDDTTSVDSHLHYILVFVYFLLLQVSASDRNWFLLQLSVYSILRFSLLVLLPVFDVLSEQIVTSELLLRQCLSVSALTEMTFAWPSAGGPALQWFSFA